MGTEKGGFCAPLSLLSEQDLCDLIHSFLALNISSDNIKDLKNFSTIVTNAEHTKCNRTGHNKEKKVLVWSVKSGTYRCNANVPRYVNQSSNIISLISSRLMLGSSQETPSPVAPNMRPICPSIIQRTNLE